MSERVIALVAGESGAGKSFFVAQLHRALIYDTDIGGGLAYAADRILRNESERIELASYPDILADLRQRQAAGQLKNRVTVSVDHLTTCHQEAVLRYNPGLDRDFGMANDKATREWRKLREFCRQQDFNLICTSHLKAKWESEKVTGVTSEAAKGIEGDMHIVLHVRRGDRYPSNAWVQKWRRDPEDARGQIPSAFPLTMEAFASMAGPGLMAAREPVPPASADQLQRLASLLDVAKLPEGTVEKWLKKAGVDTLAEMNSTDVEKCIAYVQKLLTSASGPLPEAIVVEKRRNSK